MKAEEELEKLIAEVDLNNLSKLEEPPDGLYKIKRLGPMSDTMKEMAVISQKLKDINPENEDEREEMKEVMKLAKDMYNKEFSERYPQYPEYDGQKFFVYGNWEVYASTEEDTPKDEDGFEIGAFPFNCD